MLIPHPRVALVLISNSGFILSPEGPGWGEVARSWKGSPLSLCVFMVLDAGVRWRLGVGQSCCILCSVCERCTVPVSLVCGHVMVPPAEGGCMCQFNKWRALPPGWGGVCCLRLSGLSVCLLLSVCGKWVGQNPSSLGDWGRTDGQSTQRVVSAKDSLIHQQKSVG